MEVIPISSDSLGVRSMATYVKTRDCKIFIDPSAALGPKRYRLPPSPIEIETLNEIKKQISNIAQQCDFLVISHYHYDHYDPEATFYKGKKVLAKDIKNNINKSQQRRGKKFKDNFENECKIIPCDNTQHQIGNTEITFSPPFFHGPENVRLGYVVMTTIKDKEKTVLHSSDVQGPITTEAKDYIISQKPDLLIMDGPPTLFLGWKLSKEHIQKASENLMAIIKKLSCEVILDHHLLRDLKYKERFSEPYQKSEKKLKTFAEYLGKKNNTLEAHRKQLWGK